jgi:ATP-dependent helicase/DNAse subunit B
MERAPKFDLIIGPPGEYYYFKDEIVERLRQQKGVVHDFIYLLPVKRAVRYFKEQLIDLTDRQALADPPVYTFYQFMVEFYRTFPEARKIISPTMRLFLVEEVLKKNTGRLQFFSDTSAKRRGLIRKIDELLTELREYGYKPDELINNIEDEDNRVHDFALVIDEFEKVLGQQLIDEAGAIQGVFSRLDESFWQERFPQVKMVYMNGYGLFTRPMIEFFKRIQNICSIKIKLDYLPENFEMFEHVDPAFGELKKLNPVIIQDAKPQPWEAQLFRRSASGDQRLNLPKDILIQPANSRTEEVAFIAKYVKRLHYQLKIPLHKIGITFPSLEQYAPLIHEIFPRYGLPDTGLPYNLSTGFQLSQSPLIRVFLLMLEVPLQRYEVKKLVQLIRSPFFRPSGKNKVNPATVKLVARELRLTSFHHQWNEELQKYLQHLKRQKDTAQEEDFDEKRIEDLIRLFTDIEQPLHNLLQNLQKLETKQPVKAFREQFLNLLGEFGFIDWYKQENENLSPQEKEREYRAFNRFIKVLDQFSWIVTNLHSDQKLTLKELHQYLSLLVSQATYNLREWANYGLQIMPRLEILSTEPEVLIFGGMVEGDFPRPFTQDVFFHDEDREKLGLAATEDLLAQDRYLFYQVLSSSAERLLFTYPRFRKESALVPSNFLSVLDDQIRVRWRKNVPSSRFLQSQQEMLEKVARKIPPGITATEKTNLRRWLVLNRQNMEKEEMVFFWLQRFRSNYTRRRRNFFNEYEGVFSNYRQLVDHLRERFDERPYSITRLETFAFCPIRFFFQYILKIEEEQEVEPGLTPLERGQLVHSTFFKFYRQLKEQNRHHRPWQHLELLKEIAEIEFRQLPFQGILFELEWERYFGSENRPGLWKQFLAEEEENIGNLGFYPEYFEVAFGAAGRKTEQDPASIEQSIALEYNGKKLLVTGKIDRIDLNDEGQAILLDYKTGSTVTSIREIRDGLSLQLPIYALIFPELLRTFYPNKKIEPVISTIFQVKDEEKCRRITIAFDRNAGLNIKAGSSSAALPNKRVVNEEGNELTLPELHERAKTFAFQYVDRIRNGEFRHTRFPDTPPCESYCDFRRMCRKDVAKLLESETDVPG